MINAKKTKIPSDESNIPHLVAECRIVEIDHLVAATAVQRKHPKQ